MPIPSPFITVNRQEVIGNLKATGSRDPDVLYAQKSILLQAVRFPKLAGTSLMIVGALCTLLMVLAFIGIPLLIGGWWLRRRGVRNIQTVEAAYSEFVASPAV
jgi:hypothetical protein